MNTSKQINDATCNGTPEAGKTNTTWNQCVAKLIDSVKREVFAEYQAALGANDQLLRLALIEADALARETGFPQLVFPVLAEEKASSAARWQFHQQFRLRSDYPLAA
jgi:hypothetical protein